MSAALALASLLANPAAACAVCFGLASGNTARAISIGILMLLATVFSVLTVLVAAILRIEKSRAGSRP